MKVSELIAELQQDYEPDDELIVGYWDKSFIQDLADDEVITNDDVRILSKCDYDWGNINEQISDFLDELLKEKAEEEIQETKETELWEA